MIIADHVKCNWCDAESFIPIGEEECPNCHKKGFLQWIDENSPEKEVDKYKIIGGIICNQ